MVAPKGVVIQTIVVANAKKRCVETNRAASRYDERAENRSATRAAERCTLRAANRYHERADSR